jgi:histidinol-phosphate aminotransferase
MYSFCARVAAATVVSIPRKRAEEDEFAVDVDAVSRAVDEKTKLLFLASPNNPTGNDLSEVDARRLLELNLILVVDETYFEFSGSSVAHLVPEYENLVILRSMSKWAGLAGLRVGYMIASPLIVRHLIDIKQPYNISSAAEEALIASLDHRDELMNNVKIILEQRGRLEAFLDSLSGVSYLPSKANFLLCEFERSASEIYEGMASHGVFVRMFSHPDLERRLRLSVGTPEETGRLIAALKAIV